MHTKFDRPLAISPSFALYSSYYYVENQIVCRVDYFFRRVGLASCSSISNAIFYLADEILDRLIRIVD